MKNIVNFIMIMGSLLTVMACSQARMGSVNAPGNRPPFNKPECGLKSHLTAWQNGELKSLVYVYSGQLSAAENYGYRNFSAHPIQGPGGEAGALTVFFYQGPEGLSVNLVLDAESGSSHDNMADVAVTIKYNQHQDRVLFSDEIGELLGVDADPESTFYRGRYNYKMTTDGGILGPLTTENFEVQVEALVQGKLKKTLVHDLQKAPQDLDLSQAVIFKVSEVDPCQLP